MFTDGWVNKEDVVYICNGIVLAIKKKEILSFATTWEGPWGNYAKWSKSERKSQNTVWFHLYVGSTKQNKKQKSEIQKTG